MYHKCHSRFIFFPCLSTHLLIGGFISLRIWKFIERKWNPESRGVFFLAKKHNRLYEVDIFSTIQSIHTFTDHFVSSEQGPCLSLNVFPSTLLESSFRYSLEDVIMKVRIPLERMCLCLYDLNAAVSPLLLHPPSINKEVCVCLNEWGVMFWFEVFSRINFHYSYLYCIPKYHLAGCRNSIHIIFTVLFW